MYDGKVVFTYSDIITDGVLGDAGTFTRSGASLTFESDEFAAYTGIIAGDEITVVPADPHRRRPVHLRVPQAVGFLVSRKFRR